MNRVSQVDSEIRRQVGNVAYDIEHIIAYSAAKDEYHYIKRRWLIGRRLAQEEVRLRRRKGRLEKVKTLVSHFLRAKYGEEYQKEHLDLNLLFYYRHLNLFDSALHLDYKLLPWKHYVLLLDIEDETIRRKAEKDAFDYGWNIKTLFKRIQKVKGSEISIEKANYF